MKSKCFVNFLNIKEEQDFSWGAHNHVINGNQQNQQHITRH